MPRGIYQRHLERIEERFWWKVQKTSDCWNWIGCKTSSGYGRIGLGSRSAGVTNAHCVSWELANGPIPKGMEVCHRCDNPACVNPEHLFLGTHSDNMRDSSRKGRLHFGERNGMNLHPEKRTRGERNGMAKLSQEEVNQIRKRYIEGDITQCDLATEYKIHQSTVSSIVNRRHWS